MRIEYNLRQAIVPADAIGIGNAQADKSPGEGLALDVRWHRRPYGKRAFGLALLGPALPAPRI